LNQTDETLNASDDSSFQVIKLKLLFIKVSDDLTLASGARSKTRPAWQSLAKPGFLCFWPSLAGKWGLVKPGKPGHGQVFLATLATKVRLSRPC